MCFKPEQCIITTARIYRSLIFKMKGPTCSRYCIQTDLFDYGQILLGLIQAHLWSDFQWATEKPQTIVPHPILAHFRYQIQFISAATLLNVVFLLYDSLMGRVLKFSKAAATTKISPQDSTHYCRWMRKDTWSKLHSIKPTLKVFDVQVNCTR